jgi:hypothetical protein
MYVFENVTQVTLTRARDIAVESIVDPEEQHLDSTDTQPTVAERACAVLRANISGKWTLTSSLESCALRRRRCPGTFAWRNGTTSAAIGLRCAYSRYDPDP